MKRLKTLSSTLFALCAMASTGAHALVIDFEASGSNNSYNALNYAIDGFVFNHTMDNVDISSSAPWAGTGPAHSGRFSALNNYGGTGEIKRQDGGTFSFQNLWLKSWYGTPYTETITGLLNGVEVGSVSSLSGASWTQITGNFSKIDTLRIGGSNIFLVDDIKLNTAVAPVPEPETYALMGLGLVGLIAARRRKTFNA